MLPDFGKSIADKSEIKDGDIKNLIPNFGNKRKQEFIIKIFSYIYHLE